MWLDPLARSVLFMMWCGLVVVVAVHLLVLTVQNVWSYRILVLHPLHSGSHEVQLRVLSNALVQREHQITYIKFKNFVRIPPPDHPNITFIYLAVDNSDGSIPFVTKEKRGRFMLPLDILWNKGLDPWGLPLKSFLTVTPMCDTLLGDAALREKLEREQYDVAIVDLFGNECGLAMAYHLNIPVVAYWALTLNAGETLYSSGISHPPGTTPSFLTQYIVPMNFWQRASNLFHTFMNMVIMNIQFIISDRSIQKNLPGTPSSIELLSQISGFFENSDFALDFAREMPPNVINVGCMQCRPPKPLSHDLEEFMQGAGRAGVVLFSMGATFDASVAPHELLRRLLLAFSRLPQRVIMKIGGPAPLPSDFKLPSNVRTERWLPQQDVLGHSQTRAFFTHCGMHGTLEAIWHGVPAVAMPIFGDQGNIAEMLKLRGVAVRIEKDATTEQIYNALRTVIDDSRYRRNAKHLQAVIQDQQVSPMERALWFVEHVARQRGADHLKIPTRHVSFIEKYCLDVLALLLVVIVLAYRWRHVPAKWTRGIITRAISNKAIQQHVKKS